MNTRESTPRCCSGLAPCFALLAAVGSGCSRPDQGAAVPAATIGVVRTWKDLAAQPPIDLGAGAVAHLGVDRTRVPHGGAIVLYCATRSWNPREKTLEGDHLGPFFVEIEGPGKAPKPSYRLVYDYGAHDSDATPLLFARSVHLTVPGEWTVRAESKEVRKRSDGSIEVMPHSLATVRLVATEERSPGWVPWVSLGRRPNPAPNDPDVRQKTVDFLSNPKDGAAAPLWRGRAPVRLLPAPDGSAAPRTGALPALEPPESERRLRARLEGNALTIEGDAGLEPSTSRLDYLTRWWVEGEPRAPDWVPATEFRRLVTGGGHRLRSGGVRFFVEIDRERLGAAPGDRLEFELLYAPGGWAYLHPEHATNPVGGGMAYATALSNRVEVHGD